MAINYGQNLGQNSGQIALQTMQGLQGLEVTKLKIEEIKRKRAADDANAKARKDFGVLLQGDDTDAIAKMAAQHPGLTSEFSKAVDFQDSLTSKPRVEVAKDVLSGRVSPRDGYTQRVMEIQANGGNPENLIKTLESSTDEELLTMAKKDLAMMDGDAYESYATATGITGGKPTAKIKEWEMLDAMEEGPRKDSFARMVGAEDTIKIKGIEYKKNPLTNKYEAALDATSDTVTNQERALADIEADKASRVDFSKNKTKWNTGRPKYESKIRGAKDDRVVMEKTAEEIRSTLDDYSAGYGAALKGLSKTDAQKLKGLYQTMLANSAFSTLISLKAAGGTLGAISTSELDLLKAKQGELNQSGKVEEQLRVLDQIMRANERAIKNIEDEYSATNQMYSGSYDQMNSRFETEADALEQARSAIDRGVSRDAVIKRLEENGINASNL